MKTYKYIKADFGNLDIVHCVDSEGVETWIPTDPANSDYQAYLAELEKEKEDN